MNKKIFLVADWIAFVIIPILLWVMYVTGSAHLYKEWGSMALNLLYLIMFMKPIIVIIWYKPLYQFLPYRRQLGVISAWLAVFHTIGLMISRDLLDISAYLANPWSNYLFIGAIATVGMIILGLTSNFFSIKFLWKNWKRVQWLAYPVLFLSKLHADLSHRDRGFGQIATSTTSTVSLAKFVPTAILLVVFTWLKYRQRKVEKGGWRSLMGK